MPFLRRPQCDLYYEVHGAGPPLVFLHGLGGNHLSWWQQIAHFAARSTCITLSLRGFGLSCEAPGGPGPHAFTDDLVALLAHLGLSSVRIVAQSMGGWPAVSLAATHPERVRALVLACTTGSAFHPELDAIYADHLADASATYTPPGVHPAAGARLADEQPALHFLYTQLDALSVVDKDAVRRALLGALRTTPVASLRVPLLCITGEEDTVIPPSAVAWLAGHVPGARLHREPAAGHSVYWERPLTFNRVVDEFFATL